MTRLCSRAAALPVVCAAACFPVVLLGARLLRAQGQTQVQVKQSAQTSTTDSRGAIRVNVNLVTVLTSVLDKNNTPVADLTQDQFQIYEEGKPQKIQLFEAETQQPLDVALMMDASLSELKELQQETDAAARFIAKIVRPGDRVAVFEFADATTQLTNFTDDVPQLQSAVRHIFPGDGTSIYDAIYLGSQALGKGAPGRRKALVLLTDGGETTSRADFETARRAALRADTLLYTIVVQAVKGENGRNTAGEHAIETIADTTGGTMYFPDDATQFDSTFELINRELRTQYRLGYYPDPRPPQGVYRQVEVRVNGDYKVRARQTYYSGGPTE